MIIRYVFIHLTATYEMPKTNLNWNDVLYIIKSFKVSNVDTANASDLCEDCYNASEHDDEIKKCDCDQLAMQDISNILQSGN
jgi:hypothetical protein